MRRDVDGAAPPFDDVFDCLSAHERRRILSKLLERPAIDIDPDPDAYHVHLPRLVELGAIEWDHDDDRIRRGPQFSAVEPLLELVESHADTFPQEWP